MNALRDTYDGDFEILAVPSSNFFNQEPSGAGDEIMNAIRHVRPGNNFEPSFQVFGRSDVNGANRLDLYTWALHLCDSPTPTFFDPKMLYYDPISMEDVRWNFEKILFDRQGKPYRRYSSAVEPFMVEDDIRTLIEKEY